MIYSYFKYVVPSITGSMIPEDGNVWFLIPLGSRQVSEGLTVYEYLMFSSVSQEATTFTSMFPYFYSIGTRHA